MAKRVWNYVSITATWIACGEYEPRKSNGGEKSQWSMLFTQPNIYIYIYYKKIF